MSLQTRIQPVRIEEFVAALRKFPETAFRETESIRNFLSLNSCGTGDSSAILDLECPALHPQPNRQDSTV